MSLQFIKPQLATAVEHPPPRAGWIHEVKHDGSRTLLIVERRKAHAYTCNGFDWTDRYAGIGQQLSWAADPQSSTVKSLFRMNVASRTLRRSSQLFHGVRKGGCSVPSAFST
jgi:hypothetical protein